MVGARPQFIKAAVVSRALRRHPGAAEVLVHTGQHYDRNMSQVFFEELEIPAPQYNLEIGSGPHGRQTGRMLEAMEGVLEREKPDWVVVYGDTNSTLAGALAAAKLHIPVAHVEAGLRSFNRTMPEEINRVVVDHLSSLLLAPTQVALANLAKEGIAPGAVRLVGDVMLDAALYYAANAERSGAIPAQFGLERGKYALATIHRAENADSPQRLEVIAGGLARLARKLPVVLPAHPRARQALERLAPSGVRLVDPVGYLEMMWLQKNARLVVTDSGGVQKESYFHGVPCATLRDETEWVELVEAGWNTLLPPRDAGELGEQLVRLAQAPLPRTREPLYGDGRAGEAIARELAAAAR